MSNANLDPDHRTLLQEESSPPHLPDDRHILRGIRLAAWLITITAGFLQAWASRFYLNPDGNSYLDIASAYLKGDWRNAINAYWSPLFSWLAAGFLWARPNPYWESTLLHFVNFVGLIFGLACFEFFFRELCGWLQLRAHFAGENLPSELAWHLLGYAVFLSTSLLLVSLQLATPDIWLCAFTYAMAGLLVRIQAGRATSLTFLSLGVVLGCACLTKSFYFPLSFVCLAAAWIINRLRPRRLLQGILALTSFLLVAGPFVLALSRAKHRFTFGDTGKLAYVMTVSRIPRPFFWQGENGSGTPIHPTREIFRNPSIFEFATPVAGSYPPAYDPSYWMEGATPHFHLGGQLSVFRQSAGSFFLIVMNQLEFLVGMLTLFLFARKWRETILGLQRTWFLWIPAALACSAYALVLVEPRYVAPFLPLLWLSFFLTASCSITSAEGAKVRVAVVLAVVSVTGLKLAKSVVSDSLAAFSRQENISVEVAKSLHGFGVSAGDKVAGVSLAAEAHWARLAGVTIVAEIALGDDTLFWSATPKRKQEVFEKLSATGATAVVARNAPPGAISEAWTRLGSTDYYARLLP